jgi:hypothetical protein
MGDDAEGEQVRPEPTFRHVDDAGVEWQQVKAVRNADGSTSAVWEKWLAFSPEPQYLSLYAKWDPGVVVRRHGHYSPHVLFVIEGDMTCGDRPCPAGTHIELPLGAAFGPFVAGPRGTVLLEVMMGDPRSWGDDPAAFAAALVGVGAVALPDPEIALPAWLADLRSRWVVDGETDPPPPPPAPASS